MVFGFGEIFSTRVMMIIIVYRTDANHTVATLQTTMSIIQYVW